MVALTRIGIRDAAAPSQVLEHDVEHDIVVVGGGGGGLPTALFARWLGDTVLVLEKATELGGTAAKAAFWYWVPNNSAMQSVGVADTKADCLRYMARLTRPHSFDPNGPRFGLSDWEYEMCEAIYDSASEAADLLRDRGALPYRQCSDMPDYWAELSEDKAPRGRVLVPSDASQTTSDGGRVATRLMSNAARRDGVEIRTGHRVQRVIRNNAGEVVGVDATTADGGMLRSWARKAVIFATGGFTHNPELRRDFLHVPIYGGCAAASNEGDFVYIAGALGAQLRNMNYAWMCPVPLERAVAKDPGMRGLLSVVGDSMIWVDKRGRRVVNEKLPYNELAQIFFHWDAAAATYPYLLLIAIWDERSQKYSASDDYGGLIVPKGVNDDHVIRGESLEELAGGIAERLAHYASVTGDARLSDDFVLNLKSSVSRFNDFARTGTDLDFHRGERAVERYFNGPVKEEPGRTNPTMYPISDAGPYYAALVAGGTLDTKGGPKTTPHGQVVDDKEQPIAGLYGVGNCVASPSGRACWAGGATLGPILAFAYRAARAAHAEPVRHPDRSSPLAHH